MQYMTEMDRKFEFLVCVVLIILGLLGQTWASPKKNQPHTSGANSFKDSIKANRKKLSDEKTSNDIIRKNISRELGRRNWKQAFEEIKSLSLSKPEKPSSQEEWPSKVLGRWKVLLEDDEKTGSTIYRNSTKALRFQGIPSWENLLQEWAEDIADYLDRVDATRASTSQSSTSTNGMLSEEDVSLSLLKAVELDISNLKERPKLPKPAPAKPNEEVVPHTDIRDKSRKIEIVTTASLPWRTGTAVNPLLRAAYLTRGRKEKGGKVTLMLPWLERISDQKKVYGDSTFQTQEEQEEYIRNWLKETADLKTESEDLNIRWYTAWHNPAENSIYSMGDITALIPDEDADICILEEPEHLNWYRAPGISWTYKFKHVIGESYCGREPPLVLNSHAVH